MVLVAIAEVVVGEVVEGLVAGRDHASADLIVVEEVVQLVGPTLTQHVR
jgi:hypothetical protein